MTDEVKNIVASADVVFFDSSGCPFCRDAERALKAKGIDFKMVPIADHKPALKELTG
eukprot:CAMPEP_0180596982 /NCGR_PEP_ID=MMETSP1037_2-20121125/22096_1 /TAXON_ID=632150 /ORGANISM="Azadinium spinosum, Strain 3D9" /LENGTH=56 /DNA_ID=CAMNT_0022615509 /DNA_START=76 /DNA_END=242 /DNA_ORIENTATION=+